MPNTDLDPADKGNGQNGSDHGQDRTVPLAALEKVRTESRSEISALQQQVAKLEGMLEGATRTQQQRHEEPRFTRAQLKAKVDAGEMSEDEMDAVLERQLEAKILSTAEKKIEERTTSMTAAQKINAQLARYTELEPDIGKPGTAIRQRVEKEFEVLVSLGDDPKNQATTLKAIRTVLGDVDDLARAKSAHGERETYEHVAGSGGGGGGDGGDGGSNKDGSPANLTPREREYYKRQIDRGIYKDWDAVKAELKHANPAIRRKHGANKDLRLN